MADALPTVRHHERVLPAAWVVLAAAGTVVSCALVADPFGGTAVLVTTVVSTVLAVAALLRTTLRVSVDDSLRVGRAHLPVGLVGGVTVLDAEGMRRAAGVDLDARAHLALRGWVATGVRVEVVDPLDPTPYWLLSSRRPQQLAEALRAARDAAAPPAGAAGDDRAPARAERSEG